METEPGAGSSAHDPMDSLEDHDEDDELPLSKISKPFAELTAQLVKCNRRQPCSYCIRIDVPCTYPERQKPKERRQRVFISEVYERKIDYIAKKLEEFGHALGNIDSSSQPPTSSALPYRSSPATPASRGTPAETLAAPSPSSGNTSKILTPKLEYEGESSLSAQAAFANKFLRDAVSSKPSADVTGEMASVLDTLSRTIGNQKREQEPVCLYPHARTLEPGTTLRDLPMPPVETAFTCLRMAKEHPRVKFFWNHEANSVSSFTDYFLKVYSPGEVTHADLIIVNGGLASNYLPREPRNRTLESAVPSAVDNGHHVRYDAMYCLDSCKPSAAWNFIATASHMSQTLGMHSIVAMANDDAETKREKLKLFWMIYMHEKGLSLRLGRSSTIRDSDVTVPSLAPNPRADTAIFGQLQKWTELARLQGMVYDQIYSPAALIQPQAVRTARARRLASVLEGFTSKTSPDELRYMQAMKDAVGDLFFEAFICTTRVTHLSLFCLIYRAIPAEPGEGTVFGRECIASARQALEEHERCMSIIHKLDEDFLETYVNWALLQSPFVPFTVLFCHVIETCNEADLERLGGLIGSLQQLLTDDFSTGVKKEVRLFKVLYDVACSYIKLKTNDSRQVEDSSIGSWGSTAASLMMPPSLSQADLMPTPDSSSQGVAHTPFSQLGDAEAVMGGGFADTSASNGWIPGNSFAMPGDFGMEVDQQGTQLGN
ncbi:fungal specific transcription factor [Colletotrichum asianum]